MKGELTAAQKMAIAEFLRGLDLDERAIALCLVTIQMPWAPAGQLEACGRCGAELATKPVMSQVATPGFRQLEELRARVADIEARLKRPGLTEGSEGRAWWTDALAWTRAKVAELEPQLQGKGPTSSRRVLKKPLQVVYRTSVEGSDGDRAALRDWPAVSLRLCVACAGRMVDVTGR